MSAKSEQEIRHARQTRLLWFGMLTGPIVWLADLQIRYSFATTSCGIGNKWKMALTTICSATLTLVAGVAAWSIYRRIAGVRSDEPGVDEIAIATRVKFMATAGVVISLFFAVVIIVAAIPLFFFDPCDY